MPCLYKRQFLLVLILSLVFPFSVYGEKKESYLRNALKNFNAGIKSYENAVKAYEKVLEIDPEDKTAHFGLAEAYRYKRLFDEAIIEYEKVIKAEPNNILANYRLGECYSERGWPADEAIVCLERTISLSQQGKLLSAVSLDEVYYKLGEAYYDNSDYDKAQDAYKKAIVVNDQNFQAHFSLGRFYSDEHENMTDMAIAEFQKAVSIQPRHEDSYLYLGSAYYNQKQFNKAIRAFKKVLEINPDNAGAYNWLGYIYKQNNQFIPAIDEYQKAIQLDPENAGFHYSLAVIYHDQKKYQEAIRELEEAIRLHPAYKDYYYLLSEYYRQQKDVKNARAALKKILPYSPKNLVIFILFMLLPALIVFISGKRLLSRLKDEMEERIKQFHQFRKLTGRAMIIGIGVLVILFYVLHIEYIIKAYNIPGILPLLLVLFFLYLSVNLIYFYFDKRIRQTSLKLKGYLRLVILNFITYISSLAVYYGILAVSRFLPPPFDRIMNSAQSAILLFGLIWTLLFIFSPFLIMFIYKTKGISALDLRQKLEDLCRKAGVSCRDILIFETSDIKYANALSAGLMPKLRYIFLSSYLVESFSLSEIETIFAHELGHYKKGHIRKRFISLLFFLSISLAITGILAGDYGQEINNMIPNLLPFIVVLFWARIIGPVFFRNQERQADEYAVDICGNPQDYIPALKKIHAINYLPEKWSKTENLFITHPSLEKRINYIKERIAVKTKK
ncbi:MAG: tetratricopeptide repeat protein [Candidatus Omnitrophota bacterium]